MRELSQSVLGFFSSILEFIHDLVEPVVGVHSWGWAIIGLTLLVRILLLPLAIKQTRSMKAMQVLQPQLKAIQDKYRTDREMMRKDPEKYRARKQKQQQEMMALYQREGANPAASCLPLLAQAPVFLALFWTLRDEPELTGARFYFITEATVGGLEKLVSAAGWPGLLLLVLMSATMFFSQKQMMARNAAAMADNPMMQQQKILLYIMPIFLAVISWNFPLGILLYWVTTNFWQIAQQAIILREGARIDKRKGSGQDEDGASRPDPTPPSGPARGATSGRRTGGATGMRATEAQRKDGDAAAELPPSGKTSETPGGRGPAEPAGPGGSGEGPDSAGKTAPKPAPKGRLPRRGATGGTEPRRAS
jgi:YidC/Oxa1 family membrane protein insertase